MTDSTSAARVFDGVGFIARGDVALFLWKGPAALKSVQWAFDRVDGALAAHPDGVMALQLILPSSTPPDGAARAENHRRLLALGTGLRRLVTVPLGDALWTSVVRTVMRGMALIAGQSRTHLVGNSERNGLDLLLAGAGPATPTRAELEAAIAELYRAV